MGEVARSCGTRAPWVALRDREHRLRWFGLLLLVWSGCGKEAPEGVQPPGLVTAGVPAGAGVGPAPTAGTTGGATAVAGGGVVPPAGAGAGRGGTGGTGAVVAAGSGGSALPMTPGEGIPPVAGGKRGSWASFGGDLAHTRASAGETMINATNAMMIQPALDVKAPGVTSTPALFDGVIYWSDWGGVVHATNLVDKASIWEFDRSAMKAGYSLKGAYTGSPFVTDKAVFVANRNGLLSAIDRKTGTELWEVTLDAGVHTHVWSSPMVSEEDNVLVIGIGGIGTRDNNVALPRSQLETFRGRVVGIDSLSGETLWELPVSPEPNGAGVAVWSSAALDTKRKLAFIGTGNNYYEPVSKYSDSLLAIDYLTGVLKWHQQFTMGDAWTVGTVLSGGVDGDVGATPNLFSIDGKDVVGVGDKPGRYHVRDRETGAMVWSKPLTNGGYQGGVMAPAAYADGVIYVVSNNDTRNSTVFALNAKDGTQLWRQNLTEPTFGGPAYGNGVLYVGDQGGNMWALNAKSGEIIKSSWRVPTGGRGGGFSLVDGMLFTGYGFHFSESRREPLTGGLIAYSLTGKAVVPVDNTTSDDCVPNTPLTQEPTFKNVYQGVLCPAGCTKVCHSSSGEAGLRLERIAVAHQGLVGVAAKGEACKASGAMLVAPGDATASVLHGKLALMPQCGLGMPPTATAANTPITAPMLEVVRAWIAAGAPNN